jgi:hypothetical protein
MAVVGLTDTVIPDWDATTCTVALANSVASATLVAVTVIEPEGTPTGAVYRPMFEIEPTSPVGPVTVQVTAVFVVLTTVAENC